MNLDFNINNETIFLGLLGYPLRHSFSPILHNQTLKELAINGIYLPLEIVPSDLRVAAEALRCFKFTGVNVTIPYKEDIISYLDALSPEAKDIGAVNVVKIGPGKRLTGYNTDGIGFIASLREKQIKIEGKRALILGAGGGARSVAISLSKAGLTYMEIFDIDIKKARQLAYQVTQVGQGKTSVRAIEQISENISLKTDLIVNCTPIGMFPDMQANPLSDAAFSSTDAVLYDLIYNPEETCFLAMGRKQGLITINGLSMFIHQAANTLSLLLNIEPPVEIMKRIMRDSFE